MKLDLNSLYFNGDTLTTGNTASWGTSLGQKEGNEITVDGALELVTLMERPEYKIIFDPVNNPTHTANIKKLKQKKYPFAAKFNEVFVNGMVVHCPFILLVAEDTPEAIKTPKHIGRKSLKYNTKIYYKDISNEKFYSELKKIFGEDSCFFCNDISPVGKNLHINIIKVSDHKIFYTDKDQREEHWNNFINEFEEVKSEFLAFLLPKQKDPSTPKKYINYLNTFNSWLIDEKIVNNDFIIWNYFLDFSQLKNRLESEYTIKWKNVNEEKSGLFQSSFNSWIDFCLQKINSDQTTPISNNLKKMFYRSFNINDFYSSLEKSHLQFSDNLIKRFVTSLITKPFVILTGLAGSGKTKLAQSFIQWICESEEQYKIVAVGADWINREPLLGYPNGLIETEYVTPDNGVLQLMLDAAKEENQEKPYFLVLDEMNLSHVERYFADFLSIMESNDSIKLYTGTERKSTDGEDIPKAISWPMNLFIIGTVNIDETTYMFSPKVLDRANVIEFRLDEEDLTRFLLQPLKVDLIQLVSQGSFMASSFLTLSQEKETTSDSELNSTLVEFFKELKVIGAEFGYRSAFEIHLLFAQFSTIDPVLTIEDKIDLAVMQKLLPKLHGSRSKIVKTLEALLKLCLVDNTDFNISKIEAVTKENIKYHVSFDKLKRMYYNALNNGFTSYAEA